MTVKKKVMMALMVFIAVIQNCLAETNVTSGGNDYIVVEKNQDVVVRYKCINADDGTSTIGFCLEVINATSNKNITFNIRDDIPAWFRIMLENEDGRPVSPLAPPKPMGQPYRDLTLYPRTSHSWFIPIPKQTIAVENGRMIENKLVIIPRGKYKARLRLQLGYVKTDAGEKKLSRDFKYIRVDFPELIIYVDSILLDKDITNVYVESN